MPAPQFEDPRRRIIEFDALADVLTPGVGRNSWYRYAKDFPTYLPEIRNGAPARNAQRLGMVADEMRDEGLQAPDWLVIRNASDPQINGELPAGDNPAVPSQMRRALNMQAHWAVWYYEAYGYWTSVNSAIATWAMTA